MVYSLISDDLDVELRNKAIKNVRLSLKESAFAFLYLFCKSIFQVQYYIELHCIQKIFDIWYIHVHCYVWKKTTRFHQKSDKNWSIKSPTFLTLMSSLQISGNIKKIHTMVSVEAGWAGLDAVDLNRFDLLGVVEAPQTCINSALSR